ncbi:MAG: hypothetical protein GXP62_11590 [Oligoflexia bacterium]|nr:hypothetical protein [Oligoflexia bacterium]
MFTPIENVSPGSGVECTFTPAGVYGGVYQVTDFTTNPQTVAAVGAGAANSTNGFFVACSADSGVIALADGPAVSGGKAIVRVRISATTTFAPGLALYVTEAQNYLSTVSGGGGTSGRLCATLWEAIPAGGTIGDIVEVAVVFQGVPPHI